MVIGNGMIARRFAAYADDNAHVIFASGVSDSGTIDMAIYNREVELLLKTIQQHSEKKLVYFSTCGIYDKALVTSPYILHKLNVESIIAERCRAYCIFRVSNPIGFTNNTHTVLNYFVSSIQQGRHFEVWNEAYRNLIDLDDMYVLCNYLLNSPETHNSIFNIANPVNNAVLCIVATIERHLRIKASFTIVEKQSNPLIEGSHLLPYFKILGMRFEEDYLEKILFKYFS